MKLTKAQIKAFQDHTTAVSDSEDTLNEAREAYLEARNEAREAYLEACNGAHETYVAAIEQHNEVVGAAKEFCAEIASDAQSEFDEKSEKWQEGENGQKAAAWISAWEEFYAEETGTPDEAEVSEPEAPDVEGVAETLSALPESDAD